MKKLKRASDLAPVGSGVVRGDALGAVLVRPGVGAGCCAWSSWGSPQAQVCLVCFSSVVPWVLGERRERFGWVEGGGA